MDSLIQNERERSRHWLSHIAYHATCPPLWCRLFTPGLQRYFGAAGFGWGVSLPAIRAVKLECWHCELWVAVDVAGYTPSKLSIYPRLAVATQGPMSDLTGMCLPCRGKRCWGSLTPTAFMRPEGANEPRRTHSYIHSYIHSFSFFFILFHLTVAIQG